MRTASSGTRISTRAKGRWALALGAALVVAWVLLAPAGARAAVIQDYPLCTAAGGQTDPAAYGDRVVWVDQRANPSGWAGDIWMYDFATGEETQITDDEYEQSDPDLWGDWVVFSDMRNGNADVYAKNVVTGQEIAVCTDAANQQRPKICDDLIVWEDYRRGQWDIGRYRISTAAQGLWDFNDGDDRSPDVYFDATGHGYTVAWERGDGDLVVYEVATAETRIAMADIYGATLVAGDGEVVWGKFEDRGSGSRLYLYRLAWSDIGPMEIPTTYEPYAEFRSLSASGTKVAYAYDGDSGFKIRVYDWAQETEVAVSDAASGQYNPAMSGDTVVWRDDRNYPGSGDDYYDLYTNRETAPPAPEDAAIATTSTSATLRAYGDTYTLTGRLEHDGTPLEGKTVVLQTATSPTGTFTDTSVTATTGADGGFSLPHVPADRTFYRAGFAGDAGYEAATGTAVGVLPRALVTNPVAPATMYVGKAKAVYGSLKPHHKAGTSPVRIYKWRYVSGKWKAYGYVKATVSDSGAYSRYARSLSLPSKGKWRLRAYHPADAGHAASWSKGYDYVTVR